LSISEEKASLALKLQQEAEAYKDSEDQRATDFANQLSAAKSNEDEQLADQAKTYADKLAADKADEAKSLETQQEAYQKQQQALQESFRQEEADLFQTIQWKQAQYSAEDQWEMTKLQQHLSEYGSTLDTGISKIISDAVKAATTNTGKAGGGYVGSGTYNVGEVGEEYVMTNSAVRATESMLGSRISERSLLSAVGAGSQVTWNDQRRFNGDVSAAVRNQNRQDTFNIIDKALRRVN
jgi:hypothetical protein